MPRLQGLQKLFDNKQNSMGISEHEKNVAISVCYLGIARHYEYHKKNFLMTKNILLSIYYDPKSPQTKSKVYMVYAALFKPRK